jgi:hypothetical protein
LNKEVKQLKKVIVALLVVVMSMPVMGVTAAATATSMPHAKALQPTNIEITSYEKLITVGYSYNLTGRLTSGGAGLGGEVIWYYWQQNGVYVRDERLNFTTDVNGYFNDDNSLPKPGTYNLIYVFPGDARYSGSISQNVTITVSKLV